MARERRPGNVSFVAGDYLDGELPEGKYDLVTAVAVVHHAGFGEAMDALVRLPAPGGRLVIVGNARDRTLLDAVVRLSGQAVSPVLKLFHGGKHGPGVPAMDPVMSWGEVGRAARRLPLPPPPPAALPAGLGQAEVAPGVTVRGAPRPRSGPSSWPPPRRGRRPRCRR
ncbi:SAM-dependent methyltransferase [Nonomuraea jabiensis]|uniref:SAM-dependent methyltransferase n=1 Tax=Nonomuraea jabiensis TaxID=882448 RepID=A0A7W9GJN4_9ACTN|nr:SAM-dependent methyltransferase [Nonomuraea jabiensis]